MTNGNTRIGSNSARGNFIDAIAEYRAAIAGYRTGSDKDGELVSLLVIDVDRALKEMGELMNGAVGKVIVDGREVSADDRVGELYTWADRKFSDLANEHAGDPNHHVHKFYCLYHALGPKMNNALPTVKELFEREWRTGNRPMTMPAGPSQAYRL